MHILFDLDGTLTDSSRGIVRCVNHALIELGAEPVSHERVQGMIGAPLTAIFQALLESDDVALVDRAAASYRTCYNESGILENALVPGVGDALHALAAGGHTLHIVTSKPAATARRVLELLEIAALFESVHGPAPDDRACDKARLVEMALRGSGADPSRAVMIGDRAEDVRGARANHVRAIAVTWGYGTLDELESARPTHVAHTAAELVRWVQAAG